ncbi:dehydratase [bacterium]|nr:dehydratase [bacterium]
MNVQVGQELIPLKKGPITVEQLRLYAEVSGDFNPIHLDPQFAQEAGYPSVIAHGMLSMAFLADGIRKHFPEANFQVEQFSARFKKVTFPGDVLTIRCKVKAIELSGAITLQVWAENQKSEVTTQGECQVKPLAAGSAMC